VAKSTSGKWVSRVGAAGGGKTYQKTRPGNYYGALVVIVVLGLALVLFSRFEYQNPTKATSNAVAPVIGSTRYAALSIQACGVTLPYLASDATNKAAGFLVGTSDLIRLMPLSAADSGNHATLNQFAAEYPGLIASSSELAVPTKTGTSNPATTYHNGDTCSSKSKYPGQTGKVIYAYWTSFAQTKPTLTTDPASIKFTKNLRVTMAFEPTGVTPKPPAAKTVDEMVLAATTPSTTTTATLAPPTTSSPTTTIAPTTTTTTKG